jgi:hypothetical protein
MLKIVKKNANIRILFVSLIHNQKTKKIMKNKKLNSASKHLKLAMRLLFKKVAKNYSK